MANRLYFYNYFGHMRGSLLLESSNDESAIYLAEEIAASTKDRRVELWDEDRRVMQSPAPWPKDSSTSD
jgi:hypothetical protein